MNATLRSAGPSAVNLIVNVFGQLASSITGCSTQMQMHAVEEVEHAVVPARTKGMTGADVDAIVSGWAKF